MERREKGKTSLTQLIGCYREKGQKAGVQKRLDGGAWAIRRGGGSKRGLSQGPGERVGRWVGGRAAEALQVVSVLLIITPCPLL